MTCLNQSLVVLAEVTLKCTVNGSLLCQFAKNACSLLTECLYEIAVLNANVSGGCHGEG